MLSNHRQRRTQSIHRCANDATRVAGSLADGIEPYDSRRFARVIVSNNAHGRGAARLGADEVGVLQIFAMPAAIENWQTVQESFANDGRHKFCARRTYQATRITARGKAHCRPMGEIILSALNRARVIALAQFERTFLVNLL